MNPPPWSLRSSAATDLEVLAELRAVVLRSELERLGRYDEHRVRQRRRDSFCPRHASIILVGGSPAGSITLRPGAGGRRVLEHSAGGRDA
jgi:hypothetical protein